MKPGTHPADARIGVTVPPAADRACAHIRAQAKFCKACPRRGTTDCERRCPANGAESIARDLDTEAAILARAGQPPPPGQGRHPSSAIDARRVVTPLHELRARRKTLLAAMTPGIAYASVELPFPTKDNVAKAKDLATLIRQGLVTRSSVDTDHRHRYTRLPDPAAAPAQPEPTPA